MGTLEVGKDQAKSLAALRATSYGAETEDGKVVRARVRMGPFIGREVPFIVETSIDGAPWMMDATITYVKLD